MLFKPNLKPTRSTRFWWSAFAILIGLRLVVLAVSPMGLGGDEAQYWQWSTTPDWGYFSKPPLIAWLIAGTTSLFGDGTFGVRLALPVLHGVAALFLWKTARLIWPGTSIIAGLSAGIYLLMPGVFFSSFIMSTDALLMPLVALAIYAYFKTMKEPYSWAWAWASVLGLALGFGLLAKYALVFLLFGFAILLLVDKQTRRVFIWRKGLWVLTLAALVILPNILWNFSHEFTTLSHTAANIDAGQGFDFGSVSDHLNMLLSFWLGQLGGFGLISLGLLLMALYVALIGNRKSNSFRLAVLCLVPLLIISLQALMNRAHANWAVIAYLPGTLLLAHFAANGLKRKALQLGTGLHLVIGLGFMIIMASPANFISTPAGRLLSPLLAWEETANRIFSVENNPNKMPLYPVLVTDNRLFHYALTWQVRNKPHPDLRMWPVYGKQPHSQRELMEPLLPGDQSRLLLVVSRTKTRGQVLNDFADTRFLQNMKINLGNGRYRKFALYSVQGFYPKKRDQAYLTYWRRQEKSGL